MPDLRIPLNYILCRPEYVPTDSIKKKPYTSGVNELTKLISIRCM